MLKPTNKEKYSSQLPASLSLGVVELHARDLKIMTTFYRDVIGLEMLKEEETSVTFGLGSTPLVILHEGGNLPQPGPGDAGLYHFAIVFASQSDLARHIHHILKTTPQYFTGSADHLVSEAFYFSDPEGNGIELYFDRDRSEWEWEDGYIKMATLYIDPMYYIEEHMDKDVKASGVHMGHFHLKVGSIEEAKAFYIDILGFDITAELPGALFISVGGYHHHIGLNTWESAGAGKRKETIGLKKIEFILPTHEDLNTVKQNLKTNTISIQDKHSSIKFSDPWNNFISIKVQ